jgi:hypothetical protein
MMKKNNLASLLLLTLALNASAVFADDRPPFGEDFSLSSQESQEIIINNRILLKVRGKPVSLMDVVRKMDFLFTRQYPQLASSPIARYQFYNLNWRHMLDSVIDDQLMLADAEEKKVEVTDGDVRETMEDLFGPDVVLNLEKYGLSYDETWELIRTELIVSRMSQIMVKSKAQTEVGPKAVKTVYEKITNSTPLQKKWIYQTLTVESKDEEVGKNVAQKALELLEGQKVAFSELPNTLKEGTPEDVAIRVSEEFDRKEKELSLAHRAILETIAVGTFSSPISQVAKKDGTHQFRIFYLKKCEEGKRVPLSELQEKVSQELLQKAVGRYSAAYTEKLRKHYGITKNYIETMVPKNFEPFSIR